MRNDGKDNIPKVGGGREGAGNSRFAKIQVRGFNPSVCKLLDYLSYFSDFQSITIFHRKHVIYVILGWVFYLPDYKFGASSTENGPAE